jgi:hypothetical protein
VYKTKVCRCCEKRKDLKKYFTPHKGYKDGYLTTCKACIAVMAMNYFLCLSPKEQKRRRAASRVKFQGYVDDLKDSYVKTVLTQGSSIDRNKIPNSLIELKREYIKLKRAINEKRTAT